MIEQPIFKQLSKTNRVVTVETLPPPPPLPPRSMTTRNVLMLAPTMFFADYGCHVRIYEEALSLRALGHRLRILAYPNGRDLSGLDVRRCPGVPFNYRIIVGSHRHKFFYLDAMLGLTALELAITTNPPDLIHAHMHEGALIGKAASLLRRRPLLFDLQGSLTSEMIDHGWLRPNGKREHVMFWLEKQIDRLPDAIVTSSTQAADWLMNHFNFSSEYIFPVLDSVNTDRFRPRTAHDQEDLTQLRRSLGHSRRSYSDCLFGLTGRVSGYKLALARRATTYRETKRFALSYHGFSRRRTL